MNETYRSIPISALTSNMVLSAPIYDADANQYKLLGSGIHLTADRIERLKERGVATVAISLRDLAASNMFAPQGNSRHVPSDHAFPKSNARNNETERLDAEIADRTGLVVNPAAPARPADRPLDEEGLVSRLDFYNDAAVRELSADYKRNLCYLDDLYKTFIASGVPDISGLERICRQAIDSIVADKDMFACLGINPFGVDYPVRHSLHVASLAISIGVQLGLDDPNLIDLGVGCLVHDLGMLRVETRVHEKTQRLNSRDLMLVSNHPVHTLNYLGFAKTAISARSRMVAYQIHERCNGTGYPRGRTADEIHDLAKIAAVADVFVGLVARRSFRKGLQPYHAVEKILYDMRAGLFDPKVIRGLLETISLFPLGSYVHTNTGDLGRVIRANGKAYDRPVIEIWNPNGNREPHIIDLAQQTNLKVVKTVAHLENA